MTFNIHAKLFEDGELLEEEAYRYRMEVIEFFERSPEGQAFASEFDEGGFADMMMEYGLSYIGASVADMTPDELGEIVFGIFPEKVSTPPESARAIIHELRAFWQFLGREFQLKNTPACLRLLDDKAEQKLFKELGNPANFGMAKSFVMKGFERGFDMGSEEGINTWMKTYNEELAAGLATPPKLPSLFGLSRLLPFFGKDEDSLPSPIDPLSMGNPGNPFDLTGKRKKADKSKKAKRKMGEASRKKNRKRK